MVGLAFAVAASINFPVLVMSMFFRDMTTRGALVGGFLSLVSSVGMVIGSKSVWEVTLGFPKGSAWFPYDNPALFSMSLAFLGIYLVSKLDRSRQAGIERAAYEAQLVRSETGIGIAKAVLH
jgi:cation/acetate symporter